MIQVKEVKTNKERREFLNFPLKMYKNNPCFVPPLYGDEKKIFNKNFVYLDQCDIVYYNAYIDDKIVGRISGIIQKVSNEIRNEKRVRFTRFDCIDDNDVAKALFEAVEKWAIEKGMDTVVGPLGFSDLEREGLLIEGFDELSTFEEQYNYPYYQKLIENLGYVKEVDWTERKIYAPKEVDPRLDKICETVMQRHNFHFGEAKNIRDFIKKYGDEIFRVLDITYAEIYGTVPFTKEMKKMMIQNFLMIMDLKHVAIILDANENVICFGVCFPSIAKTVQKSSGHLTIPALFRLLKAIKKPEIIDFGLIGILPEYRIKGVNAILMNAIIGMLSEDGVKYAETNLNLEYNDNIQNQWKNFDSVIHKRRRSFVKKIK